MIKRRFALALCLMMLIPSFSLGETLDALGLTADKNAAVLDFDAAGIQVTDAQALSEIIRQMPNLEEVRMFDSAMAREDMEWLFDTYPDIFFGWTIRFAIHTVRTDDTAFSTLHYSKITNKRDSYHTSDTLSVLRLCKRLKALDLGHNKLTDLSFLSDFKELKVLIISPNYGITDLSALAPLTGLEYLEVFSTNAVDVSALSGMTELRDLNLSCSDFLSDISPLYDLPKLERFWCGRTKVSKEQQQIMEEKHPGCHFDWSSLPTRGGWREHPRYNVIAEMFSGSTYIPFE